MCFTPAGLRAIEHGIGILAGIEDELSVRLGRRRLDELRRTLQAMDEELGPDG